MITFADRKFSFGRGLIKCVLKGPSSLESSSYRSVAHSNSSTPFSYSQSFFVKRKKLRVSSVTTIFSRSNPSTILRGVIPVVVDAVNLMFGARSFTHVCKKVFKRITPSFTNPDSSLSIIFVTLTVFIVAPSFHAVPDVKLWGFCHAMCPAIRVADLERVSHTNDLIKKQVIFNKITKERRIYL